MAHTDSDPIRRANATFVRRAMKAPILTREREVALARAWRLHGCRRSLDELVAAHSRLVVAAAARHRAYGLPFGDLMQEGHIGLLQAASRFEPDRGVRFSTYATWWVRAQIQDFILRNWSIVRTGTTAAQKSLFFNLRRLRARLGEEQGPRLSAAGRSRVAALLNVGEDDVAEMEGRLSGADVSLNAAVGPEGDASWQDVLPDEHPDPEESAIVSRDGFARRRFLAAALEDLAPRERSVIEARCLAEDAATLESLGRRFGVSKERVRQIEARAFEKLRASMLRQVSDPAELLPA